MEAEACERLGKTLQGTGDEVENAIAIRLPAALREVPVSGIAAELLGAEFEYCIRGANGDGQSRWPEAGWLKCGIDGLADRVERVALSERLVNECLEVLEEKIGASAGALLRCYGNKPDLFPKIAGILHQRDDRKHAEQVSRIAMAIVSNALTFQEMISGTQGVLNFSELRNGRGGLNRKSLLAEWDKIISEVNYLPVFSPARDILAVLPLPEARKVLDLLSEATAVLVDKDVFGSQDLYGCLYQRMISDRKFLATFYTRTPAAVLLAEMAADMMRGVDWGIPDAVTGLRMGDFSCGTGTLLAAAYHAVIGRHRRQGGNDEEIHPAMMEEAVYGADIMPASTHLTTSMLSSVFPKVTFNATQIHYVPYGKDEGGVTTIGSLEFIKEQQGRDLFQSDVPEAVSMRAAAGAGAASGTRITEKTYQLRHDSMDLVIMNPPYTRPTNHSGVRKEVPIPSFAGLATQKDEQELMAKRLKVVLDDLRPRLGMERARPASHGNAGLPSNFLDLAAAKLKPGGILAMVMPQSITKGDAWQDSRDLLSALFTEVTFISNAEQHNGAARSFSADTSIGEVLLLARKKQEGDEGASGSVRWVNLAHMPRDSLQASVIAGEVSSLAGNGGDFQQFSVGDRLGGWSGVTEGGEWGYEVIMDMDLAKAARALTQGKLVPPIFSPEADLPVASLRKFGERGMMHRDINGKENGKHRGPFDISPIEGSRPFPAMPVLWAHDSESQRRMLVDPDSEATKRRGVPESDAERVWSKASRLHFTLEFGFGAQSLAACRSDKRTLGGRAWPNFILSDENGKLEKALVLSANTTLGLVMFWFAANRQQPGRASLTIARLGELPVLDVSALSEEKRARADEAWERFQGKELLPASEAYRDPVRKELDEAVLVGLFGMPEAILEPLETLRLKWGNEPSVHGGKDTRPGVQERCQ